METKIDAIPRLQCLFLDLTLRLQRQLIWFALSESAYFEPRISQVNLFSNLHVKEFFSVFTNDYRKCLYCLAVLPNNQ